MNFVAKMDQFTLSSLSGMNVITGICKIEKIYNRMSLLFNHNTSTFDVSKTDENYPLKFLL